ncbi:MAG TPA: YraN family protein [Candidatus Obscuribacterales bacterium]
MDKTIKRDSSLQNGLNRKQIAALGEKYACEYFISLGYREICRNWRSGRFGEIDLIMQDRDGVLVFVEVKTRRHTDDQQYHADAVLQTINWRKQRKILICMRSYLARNVRTSQCCRADICIVYYGGAVSFGESPELTDIEILHIPDAFDASR